MDEQYRRRREVEAAARRASLPVWAEWAAWRWSRGDLGQRAVGMELGGVLATSVSQAIKDYLFVATDARFWLHPGAYGYDTGGYWSIGIHGEARREFLCRHFGGRVPEFPGVVVRKRRADTGERNRWIYARRLRGRTFRAVGAEVGLCPQRVAQICRRQQRVEDELRARLGDVAWARDWLGVWERAK